jgi:hypothetical protein
MSSNGGIGAGGEDWSRGELGCSLTHSIRHRSWHFVDDAQHVPHHRQSTHAVVADTEVLLDVGTVLTAQGG